MGGSLGGMFIPWLIGQLFGWVQPLAMMMLLWVELLLTLGVIIVLVGYSSRKQ